MFKRLVNTTSSSLRTAGLPLRRAFTRNRHGETRPTTAPAASMEANPEVTFDPVTMAGISGAFQREGSSEFDIFEWYPRYQSCQRYFLDQAQHSVPIQALSSFLNISLPYQRQPNPAYNSASNPPPPTTTTTTTTSTTLPPSGAEPSGSPGVSLVPYIRRLVATGMDFPGVLHGFFGDDWVAGIGPLQEQERRNYMFAAKSGGWASVKKEYDILPLETIPFLRPLQGSTDTEIETAERCWSEWLAMEDWMVGPRAPRTLNESSSRSVRS